MPVNYSITIDIKGEYNYENVKKILLRGQALEIFYYKERGDIFGDPNMPIDLEMAIHKILNIDQLYDFHDISLKIDEGIYTDFHCNQYKNNQLTLWFSSMYKPKEDDLEDSLAEYTSILLYMSQDFPYISINVEYYDDPQERFNEIENKFYLRTSTKSIKLFIKNFINNAIANNIIFYDDNKQILSINQLQKKLAYSLRKAKNTIALKFKLKEEQGIINISRYSGTFTELLEEIEEEQEAMTTSQYISIFTEDIKIENSFENQNNSWEINWTINIDLTFTYLTQSWIKKFPDGTQDLDLAKYASLFLNLIEGVGIIELKVGKYLP